MSTNSPIIIRKPKYSPDTVPKWELFEDPAHPGNLLFRFGSPLYGSSLDQEVSDQLLYEWGCYNQMFHVSEEDLEKQTLGHNDIRNFTFISDKGLDVYSNIHLEFNIEIEEKPVHLWGDSTVTADALEQGGAMHSSSFFVMWNNQVFVPAPGWYSLDDLDMRAMDFPLINPKTILELDKSDYYYLSSRGVEGLDPISLPYENVQFQGVDAHLSGITVWNVESPSPCRYAFAAPVFRALKQYLATTGIEVPLPAAVLPDNGSGKIENGFSWKHGAGFFDYETWLDLTLIRCPELSEVVLDLSCRFYQCLSVQFNSIQLRRDSALLWVLLNGQRLQLIAHVRHFALPMCVYESQAGEDLDQLNYKRLNVWMLVDPNEIDPTWPFHQVSDIDGLFVLESQKEKVLVSYQDSVYRPAPGVWVPTDRVKCGEQLWKFCINGVRVKLTSYASSTPEVVFDDVIDSITHQSLLGANVESAEAILEVSHDGFVLFSREVGEYEVGMTFG